MPFRFCTDCRDAAASAGDCATPATATASADWYLICITNIHKIQRRQLSFLAGVQELNLFKTKYDSIDAYHGIDAGHYDQQRAGADTNS